MKKILIAILVTAVVVGGFFIVIQRQQVGTWGGSAIGTLVVNADTTSLGTRATAKTLVNYAGQGRVKRIFFNSSSTSIDDSVSISIDGSTAQIITEPSAEEVTSYVVLCKTPNSTGADTYFVRADSTAVLAPGGIDLNIPFNNNLTIKYWSETAGTVVRCCVMYEKLSQ